MSSRPISVNEKRRKEALEFLVKKALESRKREEERKRKMERMSRARRQVYRVVFWLKGYSIILKECIAKPILLAIVGFTPTINLIFICALNWRVSEFISNNIPWPFSYPAIFLISVSWAFLPFIASLEIYRYREKRRTEKMVKEEYGLELKDLRERSKKLS